MGGKASSDCLHLGWTDKGLGMDGWEKEVVRVPEEVEETRAQSKIPLAPLSLARPFEELRHNLGAETVTQMGGRGQLGAPSALGPSGTPAGPQVLDPSRPAGRQACAEVTDTHGVHTEGRRGLLSLPLRPGGK